MFYTYQIQDNAQNTAVVRVNRDENFEVTSWESLTPGAFAPWIKPYHPYGVLRINDTYLLCVVTEYPARDQREDHNCFRLDEFFMGRTDVSMPQGTGYLVPSATRGGKLHADIRDGVGNMTWTFVGHD